VPKADPEGFRLGVRDSLRVRTRIGALLFIRRRGRKIEGETSGKRREKRLPILLSAEDSGERKPRQRKRIKHFA